MKIRALSLTLFFGMSLAHAETIPGRCLQKEQAIQRQIDNARQHGNAQRIAGLEQALAGVKAHCTDEGLAAERREKIAEQQQEVAERQHELNQSRQKGDAEKILKREKKLAEAERELRGLQGK
ncbi:DUF1090 domain-containing protein [Brenneria rubrifaciens]|uniref:DUF1090 domain-containing protein n=1 Tax=Brenneria rubrifaciens TaxID=55213 RepID=UPI001586CAD4|nr:DUF1090 domain-containing protein [Brenneria rubrifaciens]